MNLANMLAVLAYPRKWFGWDGIMGCVEGCMGIGCYGPALDTRGNSIGGIYTMERLSDTLKLHVFDADNDIR